MIKAVFLDIDGTLVSFQTHQIPESTVRAIALAREKGVKIFISTGRPTALITNLGAIEDLIDGYIAFNGALAFIGDKDIFCREIPKKDVETMLRDAAERDYAVAVCGRQKVAVYNYKQKFTDIFIRQLGVDSVDINDPVEPILATPVLQMSPFFSVEDEEKILPSMPDCVSLRWHPDFTDVAPRGINKGTTLPLVAREMGIEVSECMALGDGGNDIGILKAAGVGVAMGNASDEVKAIADHVTTSVDEDGVLNAFRHYGLID